MLKATAELETTCKVGFLTLSEFSMIAFTSAVEVLRMANHLCEKDYYSWSVITMDGAPVPPATGSPVQRTTTYEEAGALDIVFVCGGTNVEKYVDDRVLALLRRLSVRRGARRALHGDLCAREIGPPGRLQMHDPLGKHG